MSTKITIDHGETWHLYAECFDEHNVHLQLDGVDFLASPQSVTIAIPYELWARLAKADVERHRPSWSEDEDAPSEGSGPGG